MPKRRKFTIEAAKPDITVRLDDYEPTIGRKRIDELRRLAEPLVGTHLAHINSTASGGGVAEMLRSAVPLARALGVDATWHVISGDDAFFTITKKFHNLLQGVEQPISKEEILGTYLDTIAANGDGVSIEADMVVVHDPQPLGLVATEVIVGNVIWRCHIDTSAPDLMVWRFLLPYINRCDGAVFTMPEFVGAGVHVPHYEVSPCIDPLAPKNHPFTDEEALHILEPLLNASDVDPDRPILAAISRYDIHKNQAAVLRAFQALRRHTRLDPPPYLVFLGNTATDDPEGGVMLDELRAMAAHDPDVRFWVNVDDNDRVVGALNRIARALVHVSTREGFGLVVSEAMWQGTPVIGSRVGGIVKQVIDGNTGFLVDAHDTAAIADRMAYVLDHPVEAAALGEAGREHVRQNFLLPELVRRYLVLMRHYGGIDDGRPGFRLNGQTHLDRLNGYRSRYLRRMAG